MKASNAPSNGTAPPPGSPASAASCSSTVERFSLSGPSATLDPRYHAYRGDLADVALADRLFAPHYAEAAMRSVASPTVLRAAPSDDGGPVTTLDADETFALLDTTGGWAWGYRASDHLVGYLRADDLSED